MVMHSVPLKDNRRYQQLKGYEVPICDFCDKKASDWVLYVSGDELGRQRPAPNADEVWESARVACHSCLEKAIGERLKKQAVHEAVKRLTNLVRNPMLLYGDWQRILLFGNECPICSDLSEGGPIPLLSSDQWTVRVRETELTKVRVVTGSGLQCEICGYWLPDPPDTLDPYDINDFRHIVFPTVSV